MKQTKIGLLVREMRKEMNLNQLMFGEMYGVSHAAVSYWELGKNDPPTSILEKLLDREYNKGYFDKHKNHHCFCPTCDSILITNEIKGDDKGGPIRYFYSCSNCRKTYQLKDV